MHIVSKSTLMQLIARGNGHESFQHSIDGWFDVTLMRAWAKRNIEPCELQLAQHVGHILSSRVVERARVDEIKLEIVDAQDKGYDSRYALDPAMVVEYKRPHVQPYGVEHTWIDGSHRAVAMHELGFTNILLYVVPEHAIIRPDFSRMGHAKDVYGLDWGDALENGKIVKRA